VVCRRTGQRRCTEVLSLDRILNAIGVSVYGLPAFPRGAELRGPLTTEAGKPNVAQVELSGTGELTASIPGSVAVKGLAEPCLCLEDPDSCWALEKLLVWVGFGSDRGSIQLAACDRPPCRGCARSF
jgi:hypothetical protein